MGGFNERLIEVVKRGLRKTIGKLFMTSEQLRTILAESEAVVNSRPIVYVGDDIVLTSAHFLALNEKADIKDTDYAPFVSSSDKLLLSWKKGRKHLDAFWKAWRDDYLLSLRDRTAYKLRQGRVQHKMEPRVGDVLIKDYFPRGNWKLGRLCELISSQDGEIRSGKVLLPSKRTLNIPLNLLYRTECSDDPESENSGKPIENQSTETSKNVNQEHSVEETLRD
jgi:hypothetical protein